MTLHFSELFKIKMGEIVPRCKLSFDSLGLKRTIDLNQYTNSYFEVVLNNGVHVITKIHLN